LSAGYPDASEDEEGPRKKQRRWSIGELEAPQFAHLVTQRDSEDEVLAVFRTFDANGNGMIDSSELADVLKDLDADTWTEDAISQLFGEMDANQDGQIQVEEFVEFVFFDEDGKELVEDVFDSIPQELRQRLLEAGRRRAEIVVSIDNEGFSTMQEWQDPPTACVLVMTAVCSLLFDKASPTPAGAWPLVQELCLSRPRELLHGLLEPPWTISLASLMSVEKLMVDPSFSKQAVKEAGMPGGEELIDWVEAVLNVHSILYECGGIDVQQPVLSKVTSFAEIEETSPANMARVNSFTEMARVTSSGKLEPIHEAEGEATMPPPQSPLARKPLVASATVAATIAARPWAEPVTRIRRKDLVELKSFKSPPKFVREVLAAVCWLLTASGYADSHYSWRHSISIIGNGKKFIAQLLDPPTVIPLEALEHVEDIMRDLGPEFSVDHATQCCKSQAVAALVEWTVILWRIHRRAVEVKRLSCVPTLLARLNK